ncbi:MAG: class I SAM-dependent methyltransferase [Anaerolineales bacterium]|nr:class I SAM-dependent methyltransferase [Anaerolineales bacterium]
MKSEGQQIEQAIALRLAALPEDVHVARRLFNGFLEGLPALVADLFGRTAVLYNYAAPPIEGEGLVGKVQNTILDLVPRVETVLVKTRRSPDREAQRGLLNYGERKDRWIREHGVRYAVDLTMNQDASFYMDTRNLRKWLLEKMAGKTVLNMFAYTGSLGVSAAAGGAARVLHVDLNQSFLNVAKTSYSLNGLPITRRDFYAADFFNCAARLKRTGDRFHCVILDPPFFSITGKGKVDLNDSARLINKVRPLIEDQGVLIAINNALFVSGASYMDALDRLCSDRYLSIEETIPVPEDITGYPSTRTEDWVADPAPFNHSTKIAVLKVRRKE